MCLMWPLWSMRKASNSFQDLSCCRLNLCKGWWVKKNTATDYRMANSLWWLNFLGFIPEEFSFLPQGKRIWTWKQKQDKQGNESNCIQLLTCFNSAPFESSSPFSLLPRAAWSICPRPAELENGFIERDLYDVFVWKICSSCASRDSSPKNLYSKICRWTRSW